MAEEKPIPFYKRGAGATRWMKRVAVVAIICVALITAAVSAKAFAPDFWEKVACWTREIFRFENVTDGTEGEEPENEDNQELGSLRNALDQYKVPADMVPKWIPNGYICTSVDTQENPKTRRISAAYEKDGEQLIIKIRQDLGSAPVQIEKNENLVEIYTVDGVDYYIFSNYETLQTAWVAGEFECIISGKITLEEMKRIIDSI